MAEMTGGWELSPSDCSDVAVTAAEGGIGYWSQIDSYDYRRWALPEDSLSWRDDLPDDFVYYSIHETNDLGDPVGDLMSLTVAGVRRGYEAACLALGRDVLAISVRDEETDMAALDADSADTIVQYALLGKVVYG